ncbi:hypothetical protein AVEN_246079-1 [Araneus ventricosus]|uniref:Uncharacterized protein n=1 Tax=Araneus ventricosus TaxID=182803 RepID=A0A4Y2MQY3_ARAVE|nr:hypothetical protein AVEN_246079-1 [Araneus ventricosus]
MEAFQMVPRSSVQKLPRIEYSWLSIYHGISGFVGHRGPRNLFLYEVQICFQREKEFKQALSSSTSVDRGMTGSVWLKSPCECDSSSSHGLSVFSNVEKRHVEVSGQEVAKCIGEAC